MFYDFAILVPAATAESGLIKYTLKLTYGIITHVYVEFPAGCRGYAYLTLDWEGHQLYPTNPNGAFNAEGETIPIEDRFPLLFQPYQLYAKVWAPSTTYDHTLTVRIEILEPDLLYPEARLPASLEKIITFLGGVPTPPPEEVPPAPPSEEVPPTPPVPVPPVPTPPVILSGKLLEITWEREGVIHPLLEPIPAGKMIVLHFRVMNTGSPARFQAGYSFYSAYEDKIRWFKTGFLSLESNTEGDIPSEIASGVAQTWNISWVLWAEGTQVDTMSVTFIVV